MNQSECFKNINIMENKGTLETDPNERRQNR